MILRAGPHTRLRSAALADAEPVYALVEANRAHLRRWLGWVDFVRGVEQIRAFLEGVGIVTGCCRALVLHGFAALKLNRISLSAATENARSRRVAERLEFRLEGILRDAEWRDDHFEDHAVYALLARDTISE